MPRRRLVLRKGGNAYTRDYDRLVSVTPDTVFSAPGPGSNNLLVSLVLDVPEPDLSPVEDLLTPPMLDVVAGAVAGR